MNEEWFGITALGAANSDGVYTAKPRIAYRVLADVWSLDPYRQAKSVFNEVLGDIRTEQAE